MNVEKLETMLELLSGQTSRRTLLSRLTRTASAGVIGFLLSGKLRPAYGQTPEGDLGILLAALYHHAHWR